LGQDVDELEAEKDRFIWELDILGQQQSELEQTVQAMEKQLGLGLGGGQPQVGLLISNFNKFIFKFNLYF
jgi:hypothetical protein